MKINQTGFIALAVLVLGVIVAFLSSQREKRPALDFTVAKSSSYSRPRATESATKHPNHRDTESSGTGRAPIDSATSERQMNLEKLKKSWLALGPGEHDPDGCAALRDESIEKLMCSSEMLQLSAFLEEQGIRIGSLGATLEDMAVRVFETPKAAEARELLIKSIGTDIPLDVMEGWLEFAGKYCPDEAFDSFYERVSEAAPSLAPSAVFGRSLLLAKTNPNAAVADFLGSIQPSIEEQDQMNALRLGNLVEIRFLPPGTDFVALAEVLETHDPGGKRFGFARETFFKSWGRFDPAGAANHIMAKPEIYPPELVAAAASEATGDLESALQWVQMFPDGPYRDAAAEGCADLLDLSDPGGARRFLPLIRDADTKARVLAKIEGVEKLRASGEPY